MKDAHLVRKNPAYELTIKKQVARPVEPFSQRELIAMIDAAENQRDRAILLLMLGGGLRRSEIYGIERHHVNFERGTITIFGKGSKFRMIAPGSSAMEALRFVLENDERLCPRAGDDFVWRRVRRMAKVAGVKGRVFPHRFRYQFSVDFSEAGGGVDLLQTILGHSSVEQSMYYSRAGREKRALTAQVQFNPADRLMHA